MPLHEVPELTRAAALRLASDWGYPLSSLLSSPNSNPKLAKSIGFGVLSSPLHLAPADLSGREVCPMRSAGCTEGCLHTAGNPVYLQQKVTSRITKTNLYFEHRELFLAILISDIARLERKAKQEGLVPGVRLNATSDLPWEATAFRYRSVKYSNVFEMFPLVHFYDYTKRHNRRNIPTNYHLTYSLAEDNEERAYLASRDKNLNVAVVFDVKRGKPLPSKFTLRHGEQSHTLPVVDGDLHDFRPIDPPGCIVGLRAKGAAANDTSGFVRSAA